MIFLLLARISCWTSSWITRDYMTLKRRRCNATLYSLLDLLPSWDDTIYIYLPMMFNFQDNVTQNLYFSFVFKPVISRPFGLIRANLVLCAVGQKVTFPDFLESRPSRRSIILTSSVSWQNMMSWLVATFTGYVFQASVFIVLTIVFQNTPRIHIDLLVLLDVFLFCFHSETNGGL